MQKKPTDEEREKAMEDWQSFRSFTAILDQAYNYDPRFADEAEAILIHPDLWRALITTYDDLPINEEWAEERKGESRRTFQGWTVYLSEDVGRGEVRLVI
mgnify:CR=1 FL=1